MRIERILVAVGAGLLLAGCAGAVDFPEPSATPLLVTPSTGRPLTDFGYIHAPAGLIWLPAQTRLTYQADQANTLIAVGQAWQADETQAYLSQVLPGLGWRITAEADGAMMFEQGEWHGGYALGVDTWALTVRND